MTQSNRLDFATRCVHAGQAPDPTTGAVMMPIYTTSTYVQSSPGVHKGYEYARSQNPTRMAFERCIADLEGGGLGFAFASGLAAISTTLECLDHGSHIIAVDDLYGGSRRLFERVRKRSMGLEATYLDLSDPEAIEAAIKPNTRLIWIETPTNPLLKLVDLERVAAIARRCGIWAAADNTFASPYIQNPLEYGFDLVVHSTTKYLNGHSDMVGGAAVVGSNQELRERMTFLQNAVGAIQGPFDSFLALRGLKTLALRMERHCSSAMQYCPMARRPSESAAGVLSGLGESSAARVGQASDASLWRHDLGGTHRHARRRAPLSGALPVVRTGRKSGRSREPDRASGLDDAWLGARRCARGARHRRHAHPALGRHREPGRPHRRSHCGARVVNMDESSTMTKDNAGVIAPPPLIGLATLPLGLLAHWLYPTHVLSGLLAWPIRAVIGAVAFVAGAGMMVIAERTFRRIGTNVPPWEPTLKLATGGIYERLRNPMYVGGLLMLAGIGIAIGADWLLVLVILSALLLHYGVVLREERYLEAKFGNGYRRFKARVPRYGLF